MSRILFLLLLICSSAQGQQNTQSPDQQTNNDAPNAIEIGAQAVESIQQSIEAIATNTSTDNAAEQNQENREIRTLEIAERDIIAQEQMADFTRLLYIISAFGLIVGVITIGFLAANFIQTRHIIRQDRAWVVPNLKSSGKESRFYYFDIQEEGNPDRYYICYGFGIENTSRTPASNVRIWTKVDSLDPNIDDSKIPFPKHHAFEFLGNNGFLMGGVRLRFPISFEEHRVRAMLRDDTRVFAFVKVEWETIFDEVGFFSFCMELTYEADQEAALEANRPALKHWSVCPIGTNSKIGYRKKGQEN